MFRRIVFSACLAGLAAGLILTVLQTLQVVPIILEAETYEVSGTGAAGGHTHAEGIGAAHAHDDAGWAPEDGWQRTLSTAVANSLIGIGFALLLGAIYSLRQGIGWPQGLLWGLAGYAVFFILPALGLPPEIPGSAAADLGARQGWWLLAVSCAAGGLALMALQQRWLWKIAGAILIVVPYLLGAPHPEVAGGSAPQELADAFIWATAIVNGIFWLLLGGLTALLFKRLA